MLTSTISVLALLVPLAASAADRAPTAANAKLASQAGRAVGKAVAAWADRFQWRERRADTILDAYIRSGHTGRSYQEERDALLRERGLGRIED
jgi:hypothetical protein